MKKEREYDLQDRLVEYAVRIITLSEALPETKAGKHVSTHRQRENVYVVPPSGGMRMGRARLGDLKPVLRTAQGIGSA